MKYPTMMKYAIPSLLLLCHSSCASHGWKTLFPTRSVAYLACLDALCRPKQGQAGHLELSVAACLDEAQEPDVWGVQVAPGLLSIQVHLVVAFVFSVREK